MTHTVTRGTETSWGFIQHKRIPLPGGQVIDAPVAIAVDPDGLPIYRLVDGERQPVPLHINRVLQYVLPGGRLVSA